MNVNQTILGWQKKGILFSFFLLFSLSKIFAGYTFEYYQSTWTPNSLKVDFKLNVTNFAPLGGIVTQYWVANEFKVSVIKNSDGSLVGAITDIYQEYFTDCDIPPTCQGGSPFSYYSVSFPISLFDLNVCEEYIIEVELLNCYSQGESSGTGGLEILCCSPPHYTDDGIDYFPACAQSGCLNCSEIVDAISTESILSDFNLSRLGNSTYYFFDSEILAGNQGITDAVFSWELTSATSLVDNYSIIVPINSLPLAQTWAKMLPRRCGDYTIKSTIFGLDPFGNTVCQVENEEDFCIDSYHVGQFMFDCMECGSHVSLKMGQRSIDKLGFTILNQSQHSITIGWPFAFSENTSYSLEFLDLNGRVIDRAEVEMLQNESQKKLKLPSLASGLYLVKVQLEDITLIEKILIP